MFDKKNIKDLYELSPLQKGMLFHYLKDTNSQAYFEQMTLSIKGTIDYSCLEESLQGLVQKYDVLRTNFLYKNVREPMQVVWKDKKVECHFDDISDMSEDKKADYIREFKEKDREKGFDLSRDLLIRFTLLKTGPENFQLIWSHHHILMDGWCFDILFKDLLDMYKRRLHNQSIKIEKATPYSDYIRWLAEQDQDGADKYWSNYLKGYEQVAEIPYQLTNDKNATYKKEELVITFNSELTDGLSKLAKQYQVTLNNIFQAVWGVLLQKYNNTNDVVFGTVVSGRPSQIRNVEKIVGLFINTIPVRIQNSAGNFGDLVTDLQKEALQSGQFDYVSLTRIQKSTELSGKLFDHIVVFENYPLDEELFDKSNELGFTFVDLEVSEQTNYDFNVLVIPGNELTVKFSFNKVKFDGIWKEKIPSHLEQIITQVVSQPEIQIEDIDIVSDEELKQLIEFGHRNVDYPRDKAIHELFEQQVEKTPEKIALLFEDNQLTYQELNQRANQLAHYLRRNGVKHGDLVGIFLERSIDLYIGMIAILKSGGAYVPLDPHYPTERLAFLFEDSQVSILLTQEELIPKLPDHKIKIICLDKEKAMIEAEMRANPDLSGSGDDLVYVMYTSGTTGKPKGVSIVHRGVVRLVKENDFAELNASKTWLQLAPIAFDASTLEIWGSLLNGGRLAIMPSGTPTVEQIAEAIEKYEVNSLWLTSGLFSLVVDNQMEALKGLDQLLVGGDVVSVPHVQKVLQLGGIQVINGYGPTEGTTFTCCYPIPKDWSGDMIPIGRPIANTVVHILDASLKPVPVGIPGELYVGGDGLAREYLHRPNLTQERFIPNPFHYDPSAYLYKTGDLVRYLPDGHIEFLGRLDNQVKIRGYRIELGEIEAVLSQHPSIKETVMNVTDKKQLVAYIVPNQQEIGNQVAEWRKYLNEKLPEYMIPAAFIVMDAFPLNPNGKVDRKLLPDPIEHIQTSAKYVAPTTKLEKTLAAIWKDVLKVSRVGIFDNFFELGGDSINAIQVAAQLNRHKLKLELKDLFHHPIISELAQYIRMEESETSQELVKGEVDLTPIQKWFFEMDLAHPHHWNQAMMLYSKEGWKIQRLEKVFHKIVEHHDVLRMAYSQKNRKLIQFNDGLGRNSFQIHFFDLTQEVDMKMRMEREADILQRSLSLHDGPLMQVGLFDTKEGHYLLIIIHHLVVDGVSWRILLEDFETAYEQLTTDKKMELPPKSSSYQTWAKQLQKYANETKLLQELPYWQEMMKTEVPALPIDKVGSDIYLYKDYKKITLNLDEGNTTSLLTDVHRSYHTQVNDLLLTALVLTIKEWTKENKIALNLEGHGREEIIDGVDLTRTVGWFTTIYPVVFDIEMNDLSKTIKYVKEKLRSVPNKGVGYGILKYLTKPEKKNDINFDLEPEISFNYLGQFDQEQAKGFVDSSLPMGELVSPLTPSTYKLEINGMVMDGELKLAFGYNPHVYHKETIQALVNQYKHWLCECIQHCLTTEEEWTPSDFHMQQLSFEELDTVFETWNPKEISSLHHLAPMQEGMLFHQLKDKNSPAYFEQIDFYLEGFIDVTSLQESINGLIQKYDVFRTVFLYEKLNQPLQVVLKERKTTIIVQDISHLKKPEKERYLQNLKQKDQEKGFDLSKDVLIRFTLIKTDIEKYHLIWSFHHILIDGWSLGLVLNSLFEMYQRRLNKEAILLEKVAPYHKFIHWLEKQNQEEARVHWLTYLKNYNEITGIPRKELKDHHSDYIKGDLLFKLDHNLTSDIANLAKQCQVTQNTVFSTIWGLLLQKYNHTNDVVFGAVVSGRPSEIRDVEKIVGLFINTIPVRVQSEPQETFESLLKKVQYASSESERYNYMSLADIQTSTALSGGLFDHIVAFENYPLDTETLDKKSETLGFAIKDSSTFEQTNFDFNVLVLPGNELTVKFSFNKEVHSEHFVANIFKHLEKIVRQVVAHPDIQVKEMEVVTDEEKEQLLVEFNDTKMNYPRTKTIHELFEKQVEKTPKHTAVVCGEKQLSYEQLNESANQLANVLREKGVTREKIVGIMVEPSLEMIVSVLSVLKAGGAYLPIDPAYPSERIQYMLEDSQAQWLLTQEELAIPQDYAGEVIMLDQKELYQGDGSNLKHSNQVNDLAYVIYTSGSTGHPKGVMIEHQSLVNLCTWHNQAFEVTEHDRSTKFAGFGFDASVWEIYPYLIIGAELHIIQEAIRYDVHLLNQYFEENGITISFLPTQFAEQFMEVDNQSLRFLLIGGDRVQRVQDRKYKIVNNYGPTENTVCATSQIIDPFESNIPIGQPIANNFVYILDKNQQLQPIGVAGELCIAGESLARGYLNRQDLTEEKFISNPFSPGKRMYKTGDFGRWLPNGNIEYVGRIDNQVKIRGYRIEPGEIENQILNWPGIKEVAVTAQNDKQDQAYLCAYVITREALDINELRQHLKLILPDYMIPAHFIELEEFPLTANGKVDYTCLPKPEGKNTVKFAAPTNEIEEILAQVLQEVLQVNQIGIHDNFFGLGGDSIKAIQVAARLHKHNLKLEVNHLFQHPTIFEVTPYIKMSRTINEQGIITGNVAITPIQQWFFDQAFVEPHHWNQDMLIFNEEGFNPIVVEKTFQKVVEHHDALRMVYTIKNGKISQKNIGLKGNSFNFSVIDLTKESNVKVSMEQHANKLQKAHNLSEGPLVQLGLFKTMKGDYLLFIIHHLVIDGVSWRIILEDFETVYQQIDKNKEIKLPLKTTSFQSWAQQLRKYANSEEIIEELSFWREMAKKELAALPKDMDGQSTYIIKDSGICSTNLSKEETKNLLTISHHAYQTEMNDLLLTALVLTIKDWTKNSRVAIDLEGHGREEIIDGVDLTRTVGWFTSIYPVIFDVESNELSNMIKLVKETLRQIPNKGIGFGILKYVTDDENKDFIFNLNPEISFNYLGQFDQGQAGGLGQSSMPTGESVSLQTTSSYSLNINGMVMDGKLTLIFSYNQQLYYQDTVEMLINNYKENLTKIIAHCIKQEEVERTPSDFSIEELSFEELDDVFDALKEKL